MKTTGIRSFATLWMLAWALAAGAGAQEVLWNDGLLANSPGTGPGGADESVMEDTTLGAASLGFLHAPPSSTRVADDFTVADPTGWDIVEIELYAYQEGSGTASSLTAVNLRIWDGVPQAVGSQVVHGDTTTDVLAASVFANVYRRAASAPGQAAQRPIMRNTIAFATPLHLEPGTYWLDWQTAGNALLSGPWAPPIASTGTAATGDGLRSSDQGASWSPALDQGNDSPQGFPFVVRGRVASRILEIPTTGVGGSLALGIALLGAGLVLLRRLA